MAESEIDVQALDTSTIDDLTQKSALADTDKLLVRAADGTDYKILGSAIDTPAKRDSAVNSALTNLSETKLKTFTNLNLAVPSGVAKVLHFTSNFQPENRPVQTSNYFSGFAFRDSTSARVEQIVSDTEGVIYTRALIGENWSNWEQLATVSKVNTTLTDYFKVPLKQMNINSPYCDSAKNKLYYYRIGDLITIKGNFTAKIDNPAWNGVFVTANTNIKPQTAQTIKDFSGKDTLYIYTDGRIQNAIALVKDTSYYFEFTYIAN